MFIYDEEGKKQEAVWDCPACGGMGFHIVGDPEDGVDDDCAYCGGSGSIDFDPENTDQFVPERDALTAND